MCDHDCGGMHSERGGNGLNARPCVNGANTATRKAVGRGLLAGSAAFAAMGLAGVVHGQTVIYVDQTSSPGGDGSSWSQAFNDLQVALDTLVTLPDSVVNNREIAIRVAQGTYRPPTQRWAAFSVQTSGTASAASITILGGYGGLPAGALANVRNFIATPTILSADVNGDDAPNFWNRADNCTIVFSADGQVGGGPSAARFEVNGLVLQGGTSLWSGAGAGFRGQRAYMSGTSLNPPIRYVLTDCIVRDNFNSEAGAGIGSYGLDNGGATFEIVRCHITGNKAETNGGGALFHRFDRVEISDSILEGNTAVSGGAVTYAGYLSMKRTKVIANSATNVGGGLYQYGYFNQFIPSDIFHCLIVANTAANQGGGLHMVAGSIGNCTVVHNHAGYGGGAFIAGQSVTLYGSIVAHNFASIAGPELAGGGQGPQIFDSACIEGDLERCYFPFSFSWYSPDWTHAEFMDVDGPDNNAATWQDNDYRLPPRSPMIDAGPQYGINERDLLGMPRNVRGMTGRRFASDLGCYESQLTLCPTDIDADGGVTIDDLLDFLAAFENGQPLADLTSNGTTPFPDGGVTVDDLLFFLAKFEQGC